MDNREAIQLLDELLLRGNFTDQYGDMEDSSPYEEAVEIARQAIEWCYPMDYHVAFKKSINYIKAWDKFKEKINQLQTYKLFQNDKETYLSKQDVIDLVSEIEREVNNEQA